MDCKKLRSQVDEVNALLTSTDLERLAWKLKVAALEVQFREACEDIGFEIEERFEALEKVGVWQAHANSVVHVHISTL